MIRINVFLYCDGPPCCVENNREPHRLDMISVGEAREWAKREGWRRVKRDGKTVDLCPQCYVAHREMKK